MTKPTKVRKTLDNTTAKMMAAITKTMPISSIIRERIRLAQKKAKSKIKAPRFFANDNINEFLEPGDMEKLEKELTDVCQHMLRTLVIDVENDHNSQGTAHRLAKMMLHETMAGRYTTPPKVTDFPDVSNLDQIYCVGPVKVNSLCSHHHQNIVGEAYYGVFPRKRVIGLSKFGRIANFLMSRPQIQEEATTQLADFLEDKMKPYGLAVLVKAKHSCCGVRGIKDPGIWMTTSVMRGVMREDNIKAEFFRLVEINMRDSK